MTIFSTNSGVQAGSSRDRSDIGRSREVSSMGRSGLISGELLIDLVSQGSAFSENSLVRLSMLLDQEDHHLLLHLFLFVGTVSWVELEGSL